MQTEGTHPIFNRLDANSPAADLSTPEARYANFSMLRKGLFRRGGNRPANAEFDIAVDDPLAGIAATLMDVVLHYEQALGFVFTPVERDDLVAFLEAL